MSEWKCPKCKGVSLDLSRNPTYCPHCNQWTIRTDDKKRERDLCKKSKAERNLLLMYGVSDLPKM